MFFNYFCSRCYNYVDACDCIDYSYSLEATREEIDPSIPQPPEDDPPEVGTIWYFRVPIRALRDLLEQSQAEKVGLDLLLAVEELWTLEPLEGGEYLSVPVDRLPRAPIELGVYNMFLQPWEMNYFNFDSPLKDIATLAQELAKCAQKKLGRRWCQLKALGNAVIGSLDLSSPPVPQGLLDKLATLPYGQVDPAVVAAMILAVIPQQALSSVNSAFKTAVDYHWIYQHLLDGTDPPLDYRDSNFSWTCIFDPAECLNDTTDFPPTTRQASKVPTITPEKGDHVLGTINWKPTPLNPIVIPYEEDLDDVDRVGPPRNPFVNPPDSSIVAKTSLAGTIVQDATTTRYPLMFHVLQHSGSNQVAKLNGPVVEITLNTSTDIQTRLVTQGSQNDTLLCFVTVTPPGTGSEIKRNFRLTRVSGPQESIQLSVLPTGPFVTFTAVNGVINIPGVQFVRNIPGSHFLYTTQYCRPTSIGLDSRTIWTVSNYTTGNGANLTSTFSDSAKLDLMSTVKLTPPAAGAFAPDGYMNGFQFVDGTIYETKSITCNPMFQIPVMMQVRNEVNMVSYTPNLVVTPGTFGYAIGRGGGQGGIGSPYLPFNPTGVITPVTYKFGIEKSQGQIFIIGLLSYSL